MAVRKNDRNQRSTDGKLTVLDYAKELLKYTRDRVKSDIFPKNERWLIAKSLWDNCVGAYSCIVRANAIRVE